MDYFTFIIIALVVSILILVHFTIGFQSVLLLINYPKHSFGSRKPADQLDYSQSSSWELYGQITKEDLGVDVFFIHPTGFFRGDHWNSCLNDKSAASHNRKWMMVNMASIFNDFPVYAPKYREATIYAFFNKDGDNGKSALELAYGDVRKAFTTFLEKSNGRPFIIAGHSQGSAHGIRLLREIEKTDCISRLVAAYLPGGLQQSMTVNLATPLCSDKSETGCYVSWSTYGEGYKISKDEIDDPFICVNPISWEVNGSASKDKHLGMRPEAGKLSFKVLGRDSVEGIKTFKLQPVIPMYTGAFYDRGLLRVQIPDPEKYNVFNKDDFHNYDYSLFHMDVRINIHLRVQQFFKNSLGSQEL